MVSLKLPLISSRMGDSVDGISLDVFLDSGQFHEKLGPAAPEFFILDHKKNMTPELHVVFEFNTELLEVDCSPL